MALFTDGSIASISDLKAYESSIFAVAQTESINISEKMALAQREIGLAIANFLLRRGGQIGPHRELNNVVATEPLLHAHVLHSIALVYRDAYSSQLNDRYLGKWKEFRELAEQAMRTLFDIGVGLVSAPVPRAALADVASVHGGAQGPRTYYVWVAYCNWNGAVGEPGPAATVEVDSGKLIRVQPPTLPPGAQGYVVYASTNDRVMWRQAGVLSSAQTWTEPQSGLASELPRFEAQKPDYYVMNRRDLLRG